MRMEHDVAGVEVIKAARAASYHPAVALLTAFPVAEEDWQEMGADQLLVKPMHTRILLQQIEELITSHERKLENLGIAAAAEVTSPAVAASKSPAKKLAAKKKIVKPAAKKANAKKPLARKSAAVKKSAKKLVPKKKAVTKKKATSKPVKRTAGKAGSTVKRAVKTSSRGKSRVVARRKKS
jgi:DNA-binding response OmpR family regulator